MLLDAGPQIIDRLKAVCAISPANVFSTADLATVAESSQVTPARHVVLHSYKPASEVGSSAKWQEIWLVVIVVKNARQGVGAEALRNEAGPMLQETIGALQGYKAPGMIGVLESLPPPAPHITPSFGYFPLAFRSQLCVEGVEPEAY